ncbi:hypothetical protein [Gordonia sp. UCD-TK1]|uniref:DUF7341 domain-containing protein n=1 Tax=Gordonia sp. UCD-TK1 TaxID=1857893 RepID=UPI00080E6D8C|nr:hypothetical protein [Gordonia sp. UCD-TK1]OCH80190.1 hypothetical protein A9310_22470 [Gordonia sp. UCD-TK1]
MTDTAPFHDAYNQFDNAIHTLIGLRWTTVHHCTGTNHKPDCSCNGTTNACQPSLYTQIRDDIEGLNGGAGRGKSESRPPLWVDGIDWLKKVDTLTDTLAPGGTGGVVARLDDLTRHSFGPDDTSWLQKSTKQVKAIVVEGNTLLQGEEIRRFDVVAPCPQCGERTVYRKDSGGDWVRQTALQLTIHGCMCVACGTWWDRDHLNFLAEVIGCERKELA